MTAPSLTADQMTARESYVPASSGQLYVRDIGSDRPLLVLHGGPDFNHNYLLPELDRLASAFRLIYYDQRGRGKSSPDVSPDDVTIDSEVDDLERLRQHFGLDELSLLGHSWGSLLAMEYATRHPDRVSRLVLMNSAPASHADLLHFRDRRGVEETENLVKMREISSRPLYAQGDIETEAEYYRAHFGGTLRRPELLDAVVGRLRAHFSTADIIKARAIEERLYTETWLSPAYDLLPRLRKCRARTVVIHGGHDFVPLDCASHIAAAVPGARLVVIKDSGHFSYLERATEVFEAIVTCLR
jgi:proline iminopeptidase